MFVAFSTHTGKSKILAIENRSEFNLVKTELEIEGEFLSISDLYSKDSVVITSSKELLIYNIKNMKQVRHKTETYSLTTALDGEKLYAVSKSKDLVKFFRFGIIYKHQLFYC